MSSRGRRNTANRIPYTNTFLGCFFFFVIWKYLMHLITSLTTRLLKTQEEHIKELIYERQGLNIT